MLLLIWQKINDESSILKLLMNSLISISLFIQNFEWCSAIFRDGYFLYFHMTLIIHLLFSMAHYAEINKLSGIKLQ